MRRVGLLSVCAACAVVGTLLMLVSVGIGHAQDAGSGTWEQLSSPSEPVSALYAPPSGVLLARASDDVLRSDDGGSSWRRTGLPTAPLADMRDKKDRYFAVDVTNHDVWYANGADGLSKTTDGGASWTVVRPRDQAYPTIIALAVSPADPSLVYVVERDYNGNRVQFVRSRDGGATWDVIERDSTSSSDCVWVVGILQPHPTDPARIFRVANCTRSQPIGDLQESDDQGVTWALLIDEGVPTPELTGGAPGAAGAPTPVGQVEWPAGREPLKPWLTWIVGGQAANPGRFYVAGNNDSRAGGLTLFRTDDDGHLWRVPLEVGSGDTRTFTRPYRQIGGLAYDPTTPDRIYLATNEILAPQSFTTAIRVSDDAGVSWTDLGSVGGAGRAIRALALGADGANLFAATDAGIWRLRLH